MQTAQELYTWHDYMALPTERPMELIDGEYYVAPSPNFEHQSAVVEFTRQIANFLREQRVAIVLAAPMDVVITERTVVQPDVLVLLKAGSRAEIKDGKVFGPPDLCIEVLSEFNPSHDKLVKRDLYERHGVAEYWLADPTSRTIKVFRRTASGTLDFFAAFESGDVLTTPLLPGLSVTVSDVFSAAH